MLFVFVCNIVYLTILPFDPVIKRLNLCVLLFAVAATIYYVQNAFVYAVASFNFLEEQVTSLSEHHGVLASAAAPQLRNTAAVL